MILWRELRSTSDRRGRGDRAIAESAVINEYLDEQFPDPALLPAAPKERARVRMVVQMTDAYVLARYPR